MPETVYENDCFRILRYLSDDGAPVAHLTVDGVLQIVDGLVVHTFTHRYHTVAFLLWFALDPGPVVLFHIEQLDAPLLTLAFDPFRWSRWCRCDAACLRWLCHPRICARIRRDSTREHLGCPLNPPVHLNRTHTFRQPVPPVR